MPTSITTAPVRTIGAVMRLGLPAATTRMSARIVYCARSRVLMCAMLTVASRFISIIAIGLPTMLLAPTTTTFCPAIVAKAPPDGYILHMTLSNHTRNPKRAGCRD